MLTRKTVVIQQSTYFGGDYYGRWNFQSHTDRTVAVRTRDYTDTIKRAYPLDGYILATTRTTVSKYLSPTVMDYCDSTYYGYKYTNVAIWDCYPPSNSRYLSDGVTVLDYPKTSLNRDAMYNSIRKKIHDDKTNLANMLGEYRETAETFLDLVQAVLSRGKSLLSHKTSAKTGRRRISVRTTAAKNRLAWNYGIAPLASDISNSIKELSSAIVATPPMIQGVESRKDRASNIGIRLPNGGSYMGYARSELIIETRYRSQWRAYMNQNALLVNLAQHGMLNPLGVAWELMPYSFVLDWWFSIGDCLQSLDNLIIMDSLYSLDSSSIRTYEYVSKYANKATVLLFQPSFRYDRTDSRRAPIEIPRVSSIQYKPSLSLGHFLNGLALLHVAAGRL